MSIHDSNAEELKAFEFERRIAASKVRGLVTVTMPALDA